MNRRLRVQELRALRASVDATFGEAPLPGAYANIPEVYRDSQLIPRARAELEEDPYSNPIAFALTAHHLSSADGSRQVLAQNKRRQYLLVQNQSVSDPAAKVYVNFGNDAGTNQGILVTAGQSFEPPDVVPNGSVHIFVDVAGITAVMVVEGSPEP